MAAGTIATCSLALTLSLRYLFHVSGSFATLFCLSCLTTIVLFSIWFIFVWPVVLSPFRALPSPAQASIFKRFFKEPMADTTERYLNEIPNNGVIRFFGVFNSERLMVTDPDLVKQVMQTQGYSFVKTGLAAKVLRRIIPYGLLTTNNAEDHKFQRKVLSKAFTGSNIGALYPVFRVEALRLAQILSKQLDGNGISTTGEDKTHSINIWDWMTRATLDSIVVAIFGERWDALANPNSRLVESWNIIAGSDKGSALYRMSSLIVPGWLWERIPIPARYRYDKAKQEIDRQTMLLINERKSQIASKKPSLSPKIDLLSEMLRSSHPKSDDKLLGQTLTFIAAGHDTTANGTTFILYLLARHPDIQRRVRAEIHKVVPSPKSQTTSDESGTLATELESLVYLQAVINEGLRLFAPIPHQRRVVKQEGSKLGDMVLPVGTTVVINPYSLNRNTKIWGSDAKEFRPERWIDKNTNAIDRTGGTGNPFAVATFGHGPRRCIGERFAKVELLSILAILLGRFHWFYVGSGEDGDQEFQVTFPLVTKPVGGVWLSYKEDPSGW